MPKDQKALHHDESDESAVALLLIDVINPLEFEGAENLLERALPMVEKIADLKRRAKSAGVPVIYVNDNFGRWQSDFTRIVEYSLDDTPGKKMVELLQPEEDDYFVLKPKHSGFFLTSLYTLLRDLGVENAYPLRRRHRHLRTFYRQRRLHAGLQTRRPARLCGGGAGRLRGRGAEDYGTCPQGRCASCC